MCVLRIHKGYFVVKTGIKAFFTKIAVIYYLINCYNLSIHIGQAGCQIGFEAWQLFGLEHGKY